MDTKTICVIQKLRIYELSKKGLSADGFSHDEWTAVNWLVQRGFVGINEILKEDGKEYYVYALDDTRAIDPIDIGYPYQSDGWELQPDGWTMVQVHEDRLILDGDVYRYNGGPESYGSALHDMRAILTERGGAIVFQLDSKVRVSSFRWTSEISPGLYQEMESGLRKIGPYDC